MVWYRGNIFWGYSIELGRMRKEIIFSLLAGIILGIVSILLKITFLQIKNFSILSLESWMSFIFSLNFLGISIGSIFGMILFFYGLRVGKVAVVTSITSSFATLLPIIGGVILFGEKVLVAKLIGITFILLGIIILGKE